MAVRRRDKGGGERDGSETLGIWEYISRHETYKRCVAVEQGARRLLEADPRDRGGMIVSGLRLWEHIVTFFVIVFFFYHGNSLCDVALSGGSLMSS